MSILEMLLSQGGGAVVDALSKQFGLSSGQVQDVLRNLVPALSGGLRQKTQGQDGLESLLGALNRDNHGRYLDDLDLLRTQSSVDDGNAILGHILGSKDVSRNVATQASQNTGIGSDILKKMLPLIATVVMGSLSKQTQSGGGLSDLMGAFLGGGGSQNQLGSLASLLDADNDGSIGSELFSLAGKLLRG